MAIESRMSGLDAIRAAIARRLRARGVPEDQVAARTAELMRRRVNLSFDPILAAERAYDGERRDASPAAPPAASDDTEAGAPLQAP